jgi:hypothetical protein
MVGKVLTERFISKEVLKTPMIRAWKPTGSVSFKQLGPNLFLVDFQNWWDKDRILGDRPWTFDGDLFSIVDFNGLTLIEDLEFSKAAFWVRMYKLPLACMGREVGMQVGSTVGEVEDMDVLDDRVGWGNFYGLKSILISQSHWQGSELLSCRGRRYGWLSNMRKFPSFASNVGWFYTTVKNVVNMEVGKHRERRRLRSSDHGFGFHHQKEDLVKGMGSLETKILNLHTMVNLQEEPWEPGHGGNQNKKMTVVEEDKGGSGTMQ